MTEKMDPWVIESIRIADLYLAGAPPEYRAQCAKEIVRAIVAHAETIAREVIAEVHDRLTGSQSK